jgi:hypothetical protein
MQRYGYATRGVRPMRWLRRLRNHFPRLLGNGAIIAITRRAPEMLQFLESHSDPVSFPKVERRVRQQFGLHKRWDHVAHLVVAQRDDLIALSKEDRLAFAFVFHGDGRIREAALHKMTGPLPTPAVVYGLVSRLNDWSETVRQAAEQAFARCFSVTPAEVLAPAVWVLLLNAPHWHRWSEGFDTFVNAVMQHPALVGVLVDRLMHERRGGCGKVFSMLSMNANIDIWLEELAEKSVQPHLRAALVNCLCAGSVVWPTHKTDRVWIDKSMGHFKTVQQFHNRAIRIGPDRRVVIAKALCDPIVAVRREAIDALTRLCGDAGFHKLIATALSSLTDEKSPTLRNRLVFLQQKMGLPNPEKQ